MKADLIHKGRGLFACLTLFFCSNQRERRLVCNGLCVHWIIELIECLNVYSSFTSLWGRTVRAFFVLAVCTDMALFTINLYPGIFGNFRASKSDLVVTLPRICDFLVTFSVAKVCAFTYAMLFQSFRTEQMLSVFLTLLSIVNLCLVFGHVSSVGPIKDIVWERRRLLIPMLAAFPLLLFSHWVNGASESESRGRGLNILGVSVLVIFSNLSWLQATRKAAKKSEKSDADQWAHWNNFHLPVMAFKQDYSVQYANKAAKEFLSPLTKEHLSDFCDRLIETNSSGSVNGALASHIDWLFTLLADLSSGPRSGASAGQTISSVKEYRLGSEGSANPFRPLLSRRNLSDTLYQAGIFEVDNYSRAKECLLLVINEGVSAADYRELKLAKQRVETLSCNMITALFTQTTELFSTMEGGAGAGASSSGSQTQQTRLLPPRGDRIRRMSMQSRGANCRVSSRGEIDAGGNWHVGDMLNCVQRLGATILSWQEIVKMQEGTFVSHGKELRLGELVQELDALYGPATKKRGGSLVCSCLPADRANSAVNADYAKVKGMLVNALNLSLVHLQSSTRSKEVKLAVQAEDRKVTITITYPILSLLVDSTDDEKFFCFVCQEICTRLGAVFRRNISMPVGEAGKDLERDCVIVCEISSFGVPRIISLGARGQSSIMDDIPDSAGFGEIGEHDEVARKEFIMTPSKRSLFLSTSKKNIKVQQESKEQLQPAQRRANSRLFPEASFGNIPNLTNERSELNTEIPDELGDSKAAPEYVITQYTYLRKPRGLKNLNLKSVLGIIVASSEITVSHIAEQLRKEGVKSIVVAKQPSMILDKTVALPNKEPCKEAAVYVDICGSSAGNIKDMMCFLQTTIVDETKYVERIFAIGVRCGQCPSCARAREELLLQQSLQIIYSGLSYVPMLSTTVHNLTEQ